MKKQKTLKVLMLSLAMAIVALLPMTTNAQSDGFFRSSGENYDNRAGEGDNVSGGVSNYGIGETVPVGSGLLIMVAAGAGYAVARRRRSPKSHKKSVTLLLALAMTLTFTNCKKKVDTIQSVEPEGVHITLNVGDDNSKVVVTPGFYNTETGETYAKVDFEAGDRIYVGNGGAYCGYLDYNGSTHLFEGTITPTSHEDYLHFYFLGNKGTTSQPASVSIADQTSEYPVISYAHSDDFYHGEGSYSAKLNNYCAIAKFPLSEAGTSNAVYVRGMKNMVTINFAANNGETTGDPYTFSREGNGTIKLHSESATEKWAILLEQGAVTADLLADGFEATTVSVPVIMRNTYHASDISATSLTAGSKVCYSFTSDDKGSVVRFSPGNLQYLGTGTSGMETPKWRFADNQYDYMGDGPTSGTTNQGNVTISGYSSYNYGSGLSTPTIDDEKAARDLFGWGTSGYNNKYPYMTTVDDGFYGDGASDIAGTNYDWGVYNRASIEDGGNHAWRTLTRYESINLLNSRVTSSGVNYAKACVNGVNGLIIVPDNWSTSYYTFSSCNEPKVNFSENYVDLATWTNNLEAHGCVFLPAAGRRNGSSVSNVGSLGIYWSSTNSDSEYASIAGFDATALHLHARDRRYRGFSVRLVF